MDGNCEYLSWSEEIQTEIYNMPNEDDDLIVGKTLALISTVLDIRAPFYVTTSNEGWCIKKKTNKIFHII